MRLQEGRNKNVGEKREEASDVLVEMGRKSKKIMKKKLKKEKRSKRGER